MPDLTAIAEGELFRVEADGRTYRIFTDGRIEGFGPGAIIFNYYPRLAAESIVRASSCPTRNKMPFGEGGGQG